MVSKPGMACKFGSWQSALAPESSGQHLLFQVHYQVLSRDWSLHSHAMLPFTVFSSLELFHTFLSPHHWTSIQHQHSHLVWQQKINGNWKPLPPTKSSLGNSVNISTNLTSSDQDCSDIL
jgi:hypothetical protein